MARFLRVSRLGMALIVFPIIPFLTFVMVRAERTCLTDGGTVPIMAGRLFVMTGSSLPVWLKLPKNPIVVPVTFVRSVTVDARLRVVTDGSIVTLENWNIRTF